MEEPAMTAKRTESTSGGVRHRGPRLLFVASVFTALFVGSLLTTAAMTGGARFPSPFEPSTNATSFFSEHANAARVGAFLQFGAATPLAIFAATAASRLRFLGVHAAGTTIALLGGALASGMAALSALSQWVLTQPGVATSEGVMHAFHLLAFATGGPGFVGPFGIFVAGVSVTGGLSRLLPRWVTWFGLAIATVAELSSLSIVAPGAMYLLPLARFPGLVWLIAVGATLPTRKRRREQPTVPLRALENAPQA
jgi:hypothetical protein